MCPEMNEVLYHYCHPAWEADGQAQVAGKQMPSWGFHYGGENSDFYQEWGRINDQGTAKHFGKTYFRNFH